MKTIILFFVMTGWCRLSSGRDCNVKHQLGTSAVTMCSHRQDSLNIKCNSASVLLKDIYLGVKANDDSTRCPDGPSDSLENTGSVNSDSKVNNCCRFETTDRLYSSKCAQGMLTHGLFQLAYKDILKTCSGEPACKSGQTFQWMLPLTNISKQHPERKFASYARVVYDCIPDEAKVQLCDKVTVSGKKVYLQHKPSYPSLPEKDTYCKCDIMTPSQPKRITIKALDLRLMNKDGDCSKSVVTVLSQRSGNQEVLQSVSCDPDDVMFGDDELFAVTGDVILKVGPIRKNLYPTSVWLEIAASSDVNITVQCNGRPSGQKLNESSYLPWAIGGACVVVLAISIVALIVCIRKRRRRSQYSPRSENKEESIYQEVEPHELYPDTETKVENDGGEVYDKALLSKNENKAPHPTYGRLLRDVPNTEPQYDLPDLTKNSHSKPKPTNIYEKPWHS